MENETKTINLENMPEVKEYAEFLNGIKQNENLYKFVRLSVQSYTDGIKSALRCKDAAQVIQF